MTIINIYLLIINTISFLAMGLDKILAINNKKRISEHSLITLALFGGCISTLLGMIIFRHKIRKPKFYILVPLFIIILVYTYTKIHLTSGILF